MSTNFTIALCCFLGVGVHSIRHKCKKFKKGLCVEKSYKKLFRFIPRLILALSIFLNVALVYGLFFQAGELKDADSKYEAQAKLNSTSLFMLSLLRNNKECLNADAYLDAMDKWRSSGMQKSHFIHGLIEPKNSDGLIVGNFGELYFSYSEPSLISEVWINNEGGIFPP